MSSKRFLTFLALLSMLMHFASAWLRFGAKNCMSGCYNQSKGTKQYYCSNGREMGWCCPDAKRYECRDNADLEMYCSYNQQYEDQFRFFSCIRNSQTCGTSSHVFHAIPMEQVLMINKTSIEGQPSKYGEVCWYDIRQEVNQPERANSSAEIEKVQIVRVTVHELINSKLTFGVGYKNDPGNKKNIYTYM